MDCGVLRACLDEGPERARSFRLSAGLMMATLLAGLLIRMAPLGLPSKVTKYGGSVFWALLIYWLSSTLLRRQPRWLSVGLALLVSGGVEFFKLVRAPGLDAFRLTLPGMLLLGQTFSWADLGAYALAIGAGLFIDCALAGMVSER